MLLTVLLRTLVVLAGHWRHVLAEETQRTPLYIGGLLPLSYKDNWSRYFGYSAAVGAQRAIRDINDREDVLPNYTLVLNISDSEVSCCR